MHIHEHAYMPHMYIYICIYVRAHVFICTYVYKHMHTHMSHIFYQILLTYTHICLLKTGAWHLIHNIRLGDRTHNNCQFKLWSKLWIKKSFKKILFSFILCVSVAYMHTCTRNSHRSQKRVADPLDLELQLVVTRYVGAGCRPQVFLKSSRWSSQQGHPSCPKRS